MFRKVMDKMMQKQQEVQAYHNFIAHNETVYTDSTTSKAVVFDIKKWDASDNKHPDDQYAFNSLLLEMNVKWPTTMTSPMECRKQAHTGILTSGGMAYNVTLLPEERFVRNCAENPIYSVDILKLPTKRIRSMLRKRISNATVVHCLISPGNSKKKEVYLIYYSLWRLPYDYTEARHFLLRDKTKRAISPVLD
ncbi:hypothetical protein EON65_15920 [archaeon]|nr:MAG: hypothetical protein EON65_15920 [archaeon]